MRNRHNLLSYITNRFAQLERIPNFEGNPTILNDMDRLSVLKSIAEGTAKDAKTEEVYALVEHNQRLLNYVDPRSTQADIILNTRIQLGIREIVEHNTIQRG